MLSPLLAGLGLGFSLIIAIGAQNLFVLRQGLRREHVVLVAAICAVSDAALIALGVSGVGLVLHAVPWLDRRGAVGGRDLPRRLRAARGAAGVAALGSHAGGRGRGRAVEPPDGGVEPPAGRHAAIAPRRIDAPPRPRGRLPVALTCLALTWLNPHVYLDTVFLLGTVANTHGDARWIFAAGAMAASVDLVLRTRVRRPLPRVGGSPRRAPGASSMR